MKSINKLIKKYADVLTTVKNGNTISVKGILEPFHYRNKSYFTPKRFPDGVYDGRHYIFITTPGYRDFLSAGVTLENEDMKYRVKSVETYRVKNNDLYVWAVLTVHTEYRGGSD